MDKKRMAATAEKAVSMEEEKTTLVLNIGNSSGELLAKSFVASGVPAVFEEVVGVSGASVVTDELFHP